MDDEPGAGDGAPAPRRPRARKGVGLSNLSNAALQVLDLLLSDFFAAVSAGTRNAMLGSCT